MQKPYRRDEGPDADGYGESISGEAAALCEADLLPGAAGWGSCGGSDDGGQVAGADLQGVIRCLAGFHPLPVEKTIEIVDQETGKADHHGEIGGVLCGGKRPENDENDIICSVEQSVIRAAKKRQRRGHKACGDGNGGKEQIRRVKKL